MKERRSILQVRHDHRQAPSSSSGNNEEDRHGLVGLENLGNTVIIHFYFYYKLFLQLLTIAFVAQNMKYVKAI